jgi:putative DNA primase/helicase
MEHLIFALNDMREKIGLIAADSRQIQGGITGLFERFTLDGESRSKRSGVLFFFDDGGYWAMNHKTGQTCSGHPRGRSYSQPIVKREPDPRKEEEKEKLQLIGRKIAKRLYEQGAPITPTPFGCHDYIDRKELSPTGLKVCDDEGEYHYRKGWLMVPLIDEDGLCNLQFISPDGDKRFIKGAKKQGAFGVFGIYKKGDWVLMAEGMATARTLYETLIMPVFFGIDAGNLTHALATIIRKYEIDPRITRVSIAGDLDVNEVGEKSARQALKDNLIDVNDTSLIIPNFQVSVDWNDISTQYKHGKELIRNFFAV